MLILSGTKGREIQVAYADQPSPTLMTNGDEARIILTDGTIKKVSPDVFARIQGIGDDWIHPKQIRDPNKVHQTNAFKVLGNGVPVELSRAVINPLLDTIDKNKGKASIEYSDIDYANTTNEIGLDEVLKHSFESEDHWLEPMDAYRWEDPITKEQYKFHTRLEALNKAAELAKARGLENSFGIPEERNNGAFCVWNPKTLPLLSLCGIRAEQSWRT